MARRTTKAEAVKQAGVLEATDTLVTAADIEARWPARESVPDMAAVSRSAMIRENIDRRFAVFDDIEARLSAVPNMTDRAAINALAEAVADLARLMR